MREEQAPTMSSVAADPAGCSDDAPADASELVKCVWSGYPNYDDPCRSHIPMGVVVEAWQRERQLTGTLEGFFHFSWCDGVWLAYGLQDGAVRGGYCPSHRSERDARDARAKLLVHARTQDDGGAVRSERHVVARREAARLRVLRRELELGGTLGDLLRVNAWLLAMVDAREHASGAPVVE